jgi:hypothetical protein
MSETTAPEPSPTSPTSPPAEPTPPPPGAHGPGDPPRAPAPPTTSAGLGTWIGRAFFVVILAGIAFAAYRIVTAQRNGGPLEVGEIVKSALSKYGAAPDVPGRPLGIFEAAHVWTVDLRQGKAYTIFQCPRRAPGARAMVPDFVIHGPGGPADNLHGHDEVVRELGRGSARLLYTATTSGPHTLYVYKTVLSPSGGYGLLVAEGDVPEAPMEVCTY